MRKRLPLIVLVAGVAGLVLTSCEQPKPAGKPTASASGAQCPPVKATTCPPAEATAVRSHKRHAKRHGRHYVRQERRYRAEAHEFSSTEYGYEAALPGRPQAYNELYGRRSEHQERFVAPPPQIEGHGRYEERRSYRSERDFGPPPVDRYAECCRDDRRSSRSERYQERHSERSYSSGGYAEGHGGVMVQDDCCRPRRRGQGGGYGAAGVDENGFLTWPGKVE